MGNVLMKQNTIEGISGVIGNTTTLTDTVLNKLNESVMKSITSQKTLFETNVSSSQVIEASCTDKILDDYNAMVIATAQTRTQCINNSKSVEMAKLCSIPRPCENDGIKQNLTMTINTEAEISADILADMQNSAKETIETSLKSTKDGFSDAVGKLAEGASKIGLELAKSEARIGDNTTKTKLADTISKTAQQLITNEFVQNFKTAASASQKVTSKGGGVNRNVDQNSITIITNKLVMNTTSVQALKKELETYEKHVVEEEVKGPFTSFDAFMDAYKSMVIVCAIVCGIVLMCSCVASAFMFMSDSGKMTITESSKLGSKGMDIAAAKYGGGANIIFNSGYKEKFNMLMVPLLTVLFIITPTKN